MAITEKQKKLLTLAAVGVGIYLVMKNRAASAGNYGTGQGTGGYGTGGYGTGAQLGVGFQNAVNRVLGTGNGTGTGMQVGLRYRQGA